MTPIPSGTKDILPAEAAELRLLQEAIRRVFISFGYQEVITPTLELETEVDTAAEQRFKKSFRLLDESGNVMVLRPDMTMPIARLVAAKLSERMLPLRLCYFASSFRPARPQRGRWSEFRQAGLEMIGSDSSDVDAEMLAIICQALDACRLQDYALVLGDVSFLAALLDNAGVTGPSRQPVYAALAGRDLVALGQAVESMEIAASDKQSILDVASLRGGAEVLGKAKDLVRGAAMDKALKRLARTYYLVSRHGFARHIMFDLGLLRNFDYYTGIIFEVLSGGLGFPIGGGGRYDGLLARFGRPAPAVGFALGLDRLHIAVSAQQLPPDDEKPGVLMAGALDTLLDFAMELREVGISVMGVDLEITTEAALRLAIENGLSHVLMPRDGAFRLLQAGTGDHIDLEKNEVAQRLAP